MKKFLLSLLTMLTALTASAGWDDIPDGALAIITNADGDKTISLNGGNAWDIKSINVSDMDKAGYCYVRFDQIEVNGVQLFKLRMAKADGSFYTPSWASPANDGCINFQPGAGIFVGGNKNQNGTDAENHGVFNVYAGKDGMYYIMCYGKFNYLVPGIGQTEDMIAVKLQFLEPDFSENIEAAWTGKNNGVPSVLTIDYSAAEEAYTTAKAKPTKANYEALVKAIADAKAEYIVNVITNPGAEENSNGWIMVRDYGDATAVGFINNPGNAHSGNCLFEPAGWGPKSAWMEQTVSLPAGKYVLTAYSMASLGQNVKIALGESESAEVAGKGDAGAERWMMLETEEVNLTDRLNEITISGSSSTTGGQEWANFDDFAIWRTGDAELNVSVNFMDEEGDMIPVAKDGSTTVQKDIAGIEASGISSLETASYAIIDNNGSAVVSGSLSMNIKGFAEFEEPVTLYADEEYDVVIYGEGEKVLFSTKVKGYATKDEYTVYAKVTADNQSKTFVGQVLKVAEKNGVATVTLPAAKAGPYTMDSQKVKVNIDAEGNISTIEGQTLNFKEGTTDIVVTVTEVYGKLVDEKIEVFVIAKGDNDKDVNVIYSTDEIVDPKEKETLISYEGTATLPEGVEISGTTVMGSNNIQLKNGYATDGAFNGNAITLSVDGGFKKDDVLYITGFINNNDASKRGTVEVFAMDGDGNITKLWTGEDFVNTYNSGSEPVEQIWTLTQDVEKIYIGRNGNTSTNVTNITVTRNDPTPVNTVKAAKKEAKKAVKYVKNGRLVIEKNGKKYNAAGAEM